jgi:hypothetical protein
MKRILISKSPYNLKYNLTHPWTIITHYWRELKYFVQRGLYGYADDSVWSFCVSGCQVL